MNTEGARTPRQEEQEICRDSDLNLRIQDPGLRKEGGREKASESRAWGLRAWPHRAQREPPTPRWAGTAPPSIARKHLCMLERQAEARAQDRKADPAKPVMKTAEHQQTEKLQTWPLPPVRCPVALSDPQSAILGLYICPSVPRQVTSPSIPSPNHDLSLRVPAHPAPSCPPRPAGPTPAYPIVAEVLAVLRAEDLDDQAVEVQPLHQHPGEGTQEEVVQESGQHAAWHLRRAPGIGGSSPPCLPLRPSPGVGHHLGSEWQRGACDSGTEPRRGWLGTHNLLVVPKFPETHPLWENTGGGGTWLATHSPCPGPT